jgi:methyl-accepting chemotaxis protein
VSEIIGATNSLNDSTDLSASLLQNSKDLLSLSESLVAAGSTANTEYVNAMLQLSKDIGDMADRIGEMADRILVMSDNIGEMADKIVETQKIQSENVALTQANILKAQENFLSVLK